MNDSSEIVNNAGLFVNPLDISEIATKMQQISIDPILLDKLSQNSLIRSKIFSWETNAKQILELYENIESKPIENFEDSYDLAAFRTLTTICELFPNSKQSLVESLLQFDYTKMIDWALEFGLKDPQIQDFLKPFEDWLIKHQQITSIV